MIALDTSVAVAALLDWHEAHVAARSVSRGAAIPAHALLETYAVLTRLPSPHRLAPDIACRLLVARFPPELVLIPDPALTVGVVPRLAAAAVAGGSTYDALVGLTAAEHGFELHTRDVRAIATYEAMLVPFRLVAS